MHHSKEHEENFREKQLLMATGVTTQTASPQVPEPACVGHRHTLLLVAPACHKSSHQSHGIQLQLHDTDKSITDGIFVGYRHLKPD